MNISEVAKAQFRSKLSQDLLYVVVPEWNNAKIYYRAATTFKEQTKIMYYANKNMQSEAVAMSFIIRACDEEGNRLFKPVQMPEIINEFDPDIIGRIVREMNSKDNEDLETIKKN